MVKQIKNKKVYEENINNIEGKAQAIVFPDSVSEICNLIKLSNDIVPRGAGSSIVGGVTPKNSVIVDMSKMNKVFEVDTVGKYAYVEAGVLVSDLNEDLEEHNLEFPIETIFYGIETIGGMAAKNSCGSREIKYGKMINWVDSIEVVNGNGRDMKIAKSDLGDYIGMEGITGIITKLKLRLTNKRKRSLTILKSDKLDDIVVANRRLRLRQDVCSIDLINKEIATLLGLENKYHLFIEFENDEGVFKEEDYRKFMKIKNKAYNKIAGEGFYIIDSIKIFSESIEDFILYLENNRIPYFSHLGSGVFYVCFKDDAKEKLKQIEMLNFAKKLRAKISYSFGFGLTRKEYIERTDEELARRIKDRHDPSWKLNRNKMINFSKRVDELLDSQERSLEEEGKEEVKDEDVVEIIDEVVEKQTKIDDMIFDRPAEKEMEDQKDNKELINQEVIPTLKREDNLSPEEKEKIKRIASGFFGGKKD